MLLRGEGLYDPHISHRRKARDPARRAPAAAVPAVAHKGLPGMDAENERLRKRLAKAEVKLVQTRAALDIMGKRSRFRRRSPRARFAESVRQVSQDTFDLLEPVTDVKKACELTGKLRANRFSAGATVFGPAAGSGGQPHRCAAAGQR